MADRGSIERSGGRLVLWHATTEEAAKLILAGGFADGADNRDGDLIVGVWVANNPTDRNDGARGSVRLRVLVAAEERELGEWEIIEETLPDDEPPPEGLNEYRKWCIPAAFVSARATIERDE